MKQPQTRAPWICALWVIVLAAVATASFAQAPDKAAGYPSKPIKLVVAYPPGAAVDIIARAVAQRMTETTGQPMILEYRSGANGLVGAETVAKSAPDGYTFLVIDRGALTINPSLYKSLPYDPLKDFAYTGVLTELRFVLAINPSLPATTFREFVQLVRAKPGALNYASFGIGSLIHFNFERLKAQAGIDLTHIPYKGTFQAATAVITNEAAVMMASAAGVTSFVRDGRMRALAVGSPNRLSTLPEVPTMSEVGGGEDTLVPNYFTFAAPAGTPRSIILRMNADIGRILLSPNLSELFSKAGLSPRTSTPEEFTESVRLDIARFGNMVKALGITPQ
jgi:tripartite-type tricarboxylate transporter receptor subunit TctC